MGFWWSVETRPIHLLEEKTTMLKHKTAGPPDNSTGSADHLLGLAEKMLDLTAAATNAETAMAFRERGMTSSTRPPLPTCTAETRREATCR